MSPLPARPVEPPPRPLLVLLLHAGGAQKYPSTSKFARRGVGDFNGRTVTAARPTAAVPGTPEKVAVLEERARLGLSLWHPHDAPMDVESRQLGVA